PCVKNMTYMRSDLPLAQVRGRDDLKAAGCPGQWYWVSARRRPQASPPGPALARTESSPCASAVDTDSHHTLPPTVFPLPLHSYTKLGFGGNFEPNALIPTYIALAAKPPSTVSGGKDDIPDLDFYIGHEATVPRNNYNVDYPIREGIVSNWDNMEKYLQ